MARKSAGAGEDIQELEAGGARAGSAPAVRGDIVEYDPEAAPVQAAPVVAQSAPTDGTLDVPQDFFAARDELIDRLGLSNVAAAQAAGPALTPGERRPQVLGVGVGFKFTAGTLTGEVAVKVFVAEKLPESELNQAMAVPADLGGLPTDVEAILGIRPHSYAFRYQRPVRCGVSVGQVNVTAGTIGCLVVRNNKHLCILSNNHILANVNQATPGDRILQPGPADGGVNPSDGIAILEDFIPLNAFGPNLVDAAVAHTAFEFVDPRHMTYTLNPEPATVTLGMTVMKNGRTTQSTLGTVTDIGINNVRVGYETGLVASFNNQIVVRGIGGGPFSLPGDSGSLIVTANTKRPVALLFAGSNDSRQTYANPIGAVIQALGIDRFLGEVPQGA